MKELHIEMMILSLEWEEFLERALSQGCVPSPPDGGHRRPGPDT